MASRKPSISRKTPTRAPRKPSTVKECCGRQRGHAPDCPAVTPASSAPPPVVVETPKPLTFEVVVASLRGIEESMEKIAERMADLLAQRGGPAPKKAKAEPTPEPTAPAPALQGPDAKCACGKSFVGASGGHGKTKCAEPPPSFEELREKAVAYAQKHSKAKMLEVLAPFAGVPAENVKLSLIPEEKRAAAMLALD